jgi:hypothetical protein
MAAPTKGPVVIAVAAQDAAPPPTMAAPVSASKAVREDAPVVEKHDDEYSGSWETASLYLCYLSSRTHLISSKLLASACLLASLIDLASRHLHTK